MSARKTRPKLLKGVSSMMKLVVFLAALIILRAMFLSTHNFMEGFNIYDVATMTLQIFAIMDPVSALPLYLYFEQRAPPEQRREVRTTITIAVIMLLVFFAMIGDQLLKLLGISVYSFMLGGGVLLMVLAVDMMGEGPRTKGLDPQEAAIVPLASPLLVGPGTAVTLIILANTKPLSSLLASIVILSVITALIIRFSSGISSFLGRNGIRAVSRLLSIIIAGTAAQMIYEGLVGWGLIG